MSNCPAAPCFLSLMLSSFPGLIVRSVRRRRRRRETLFDIEAQPLETNTIDGAAFSRQISLASNELPSRYCDPFFSGTTLCSLWGFSRRRFLLLTQSPPLERRPGFSFFLGSTTNEARFCPWRLRIAFLFALFFGATSTERAFFLLYDSVPAVALTPVCKNNRVPPGNSAAVKKAALTRLLLLKPGATTRVNS